MNIKEKLKESSAQITREAQKYIAGGVVLLNRKVEPNITQHLPRIFPAKTIRPGKQGSSYAHSEEDIDKTLEVTWEVLKQM